MTIELSLLARAIVLGLVHAVGTGQFTTLQHGMQYGLSPHDEKKPLTGVERASSEHSPTISFHLTQAYTAVQRDGAVWRRNANRPPTGNGGEIGMQGAQAVLRSATTKAIRRIVPFTMLMFVLSFLDRVNAGFANQGLSTIPGWATPPSPLAPVSLPRRPVMRLCCRLPRLRTLRSAATL